MRSIKRLRDLGEEALELIKPSYPKDLALLVHSSVPQTGLALASLVSKTGFISNAIFDLSETDNLYSINVLFRCQIEHYLKSQYLFTRCVSDKSDSVGLEYYRFCDLVEQADYLYARNKVSSLVDPTQRESPPFDLLRQADPTLQEFSNEEIRQKALQFKHGKIIESLLHLIYHDKDVQDSNFLLTLIPRYSELSTFVHGGPSSDKFILTASPEDRDKETFELAQFALLMATHVKLNIYVLFFNLDKDFGRPCSGLQLVLKRTIAMGAT